MNRRFSPALLGTMLAFLSTPMVQARPIYVDDNTCPEEGAGTPGDPYCRIQSGIDAAVDGDVVMVSDGT